MVQVLPFHSFIYSISCLVKYTTIYYCFCVKRIMLCVCLCSSSSYFSASLIWNIGEFGARKYFIDDQTANAIHLFVPMKRKFFGSHLFSKQATAKGNSPDKYGHLFICFSLKYTLSIEQKPVYTVKILISEQTTLLAVLYFG